MEEECDFLYCHWESSLDIYFYSVQDCCVLKDGGKMGVYVDAQLTCW